MKSNKWNVATVNALVLSLVTILATLISSTLTPTGFFAILLWVIKLVVTIWLLYYFVKQYAKERETFPYGEGFKFAFLVSLLSALFVGCYYFIHYAFIFPEDVDKIAEMINNAIAARGGDTSVADYIIRNFPQFMLLWNIVYLTIVGLIISSIVASFTKKTDIFKGDTL
jgi:hypothetical protein